jgi:hypothetical protein
MSWVHIFKRFGGGAVPLVDVLRRGPTCNPSSRCRNDEKDLDLPACVYAYLGRGEPAFGECGFILKFGDFLGFVSPFDTGGLLTHTKPIDVEELSVKQQYIKSFTWKVTSADSMRALVSEYPGNEEAALRAYQNGEHPKHHGPHDVWHSAWAGTPFPIWRDNVAARARTWEGRIPNALPTPDIVAWSCPTSLYEQVQGLADAATGKDLDWFVSLFAKYVQGGVGQMLRELVAGSLGA